MMNAKQARDFGFVDSIVKPVALAAFLDNNFSNQKDYNKMSDQKTGLFDRVKNFLGWADKSEQEIEALLNDTGEGKPFVTPGEVDAKIDEKLSAAIEKVEPGDNQETTEKIKNLENTVELLLTAIENQSERLKELAENSQLIEAKLEESKEEGEDKMAEIARRVQAATLNPFQGETARADGNGVVATAEKEGEGNPDEKAKTQILGSADDILGMISARK